MTSPEIDDWSPPVVARTQAWARFHGYRFHCHRVDFKFNRHIYWQKLIVLLSMLKQIGADDRLFWIDADAVVTTPRLAINDVLPPQQFRYAHVLAAPDESGMNAGVMLLRPTIHTADALRTALARRDLDPHPQCDQEALRQHFAAHPESLTLVPPRLINSHPDRWLPGDLICHCYHTREKSHATRQWLDRAAADSSILFIP